ncbi:coiled-coil domain-containing protein [Cellulosilyticum ruminicola]|uniref:hypothetical protein n=1 Tax=Cellulosilyticum ruminicola TaxID=425254 RepID=UPI0006D191AB|nr:hypothetical protein [Cellulosilyticum ruminicola]
MSDVTFGVKVTEEMKNELADLMKNNALSGKEFMSMLLTSYKLEKSRSESHLFESDMKELQVLLNRVQKLYLHMTEKSEITYEERLKEIEEVISQKEEEEKVLRETCKNFKAQLAASQKEIAVEADKVKSLNETLKSVNIELQTNKTQLKNNLLLHEKFEEEVADLKEKLEATKRLEVEISEHNEENNKLKNRNDELASEVWFLQREVEKLTEEKNQLLIKHEEEKIKNQSTYELELKNKLLEQKLQLTEEINNLKEENRQLERTYNEKIEAFYTKLGERDKKS